MKVLVEARPAPWPLVLCSCGADLQVTGAEDVIPGGPSGTVAYVPCPFCGAHNVLTVRVHNGSAWYTDRVEAVHAAREERRASRLRMDLSEDELVWLRAREHSSDEQGS